MTHHWFDADLLRAMARYRRVPPDVAIFMFHSDRREAGLGALDDTKRYPANRSYVYSPVIRTKFRQWSGRDQDERIVYDFRINIPAHVKVPPIGRPGYNANDALTLIQVPARSDHKRIHFARTDFEDQRGRNQIAKALRKARDQIRRGLVP